MINSRAIGGIIQTVLLTMVFSGGTVWAQGGGCTFNGQQYGVGDVFPAGDGCNLCQCLAPNSVSCTDEICFTCTFNGQIYDVGETFPAGDGCNTCECTAPNNAVCSDNVCPAAVPTISEGGLLFMALLLLMGGILRFKRFGG